jgi:hypothetical protein
MSLPLGALAVLVAFLFASTIKNLVIRRQHQSGAVKPLTLVIANFLLVFYYMYLSLTRRALDVFNCNPTVPDDGFTYTEFTSLECSGTGGLCRCGEGLQARLQAPATLCFIIYSVGFPAFVFFTLKKNKLLIKEDQLLRALELGDTIDTSRKDVLFVRVKYHKIYYHFKPGKTYWITYIIFRKFMIAFSGLMFRGNPGFQLAVILLVLFACYILQVKHRPYMSSMERQQVVTKFHEKAEDGQSEWHRVIDERIKAQAKRDRTHIRGGGRVGKSPVVRQKDEPMGFFWDYNTVEAILLACSVLICLAGIMFESDRFEGRDDVNWQRDIITTCVLLVIVLSMMYYSLVFASEVFQVTPYFLVKLFMDKRRRSKSLEGDIEMGNPMGSMNENPMLKLKMAKDREMRALEKKEAGKAAQYKRELEELEAINKNLENKLLQKTNSNLHQQEKERAKSQVRKKRGKRKPKLENQMSVRQVSGVWKEIIGDDGKAYYWNQTTGETSWDKH